MNIAILGAGAWGTALAIALTEKHSVTLWTRSGADALARRRESAYLPGIAIPVGVRIVAAIEDALGDAETALVVTPTAGLRETLARIRAAGATPSVVLACKGFEASTSLLPHQVVAEVLGEAARCAVLSGPSFALEVAQGLPTAITLAAVDADLAESLALALHKPRFRVYFSDDVIGVEVGGAVKNVMAIATGIADGLGLGLNARAALITRGLAEVTRLGVRLGGRPETFMGLAGAGDLILTCTGDLSRNRRVGLGLGRGESLADILRGLGHVAEGVHTAREVAASAAQNGVDMPVTQAVCAVLSGSMSARDAVGELLDRDPKRE